ncbi:MAG: STAS domain-containing protein [Azovibrio sp.]|nr:STAS domain-containing protein [Azovibrio sp.]
MLERRQHIRFHPGTRLSATIHGSLAGAQDEICGPVEDVSSRGFKVLLPEHRCSHLKPGQTIRGRLHSESGSRDWSGCITHLVPRNGSIGIGIVLESAPAHTAPLQDTLAEVVQDPKTGGISVKRQGNDIILTVVGHLSLVLSRDFLHLVRHSTLAGIDLGQCTGMDSAGLGMLCIAAEARIPLTNATGVVKELLDVARIPVAGEARPGAKRQSRDPIMVSAAKPHKTARPTPAHARAWARGEP